MFTYIRCNLQFLSRWSYLLKHPHISFKPPDRATNRERATGYIQGASDSLHHDKFNRELQVIKPYKRTREPSIMPHGRSQYGTGCQDIRPHTPVEDLYNMIDEHLAWQIETSQNERPSSSGTMFVDWDGTGEPKITYRNFKEPLRSAPAPAHSQHDSKPFNMAHSLRPVPPLPWNVDQQRTITKNEKICVELAQRKRTTTPFVVFSRHDSVLSTTSQAQKPPSRKPSTREAPQTVVDGEPQIIYRPSRAPKPSRIYRPAYTAGYDASTDFMYTYNRRIVHVHRDAEKRSSHHSEYCVIDAEEYDPEGPLVIDPSLISPVEQKKRDRFVGFVQKLLRKFDRLGIMKELGKSGGW